MHLADPIKEVSDKRELELTAEIEKFYARADATAKANNKVEPLIRRVTEGHAKLLVKFYRSFHKDLSEHVAEFRKLNQGLMLKLEAKSVEKRPADQQPKGEVSLLNISLNDPHATSNKTSTSFVGSEIKKKTDSDKKLQGILGPYSYRVVTQLYLLTQSKELLQFQDDRSELYKLLLVILMISFEKPEAASVYLEAFLRSPIVAEETGNKEIASKITAIKDIDATKERKQHDKLNLQNFSKTARQVCEWFAGLAPTDKDKQCFEEARTIFDAKENSTHMPSSLSFFKLDKDGLPTLETFSPTPS